MALPGKVKMAYETIIAALEDACTEDNAYLRWGHRPVASWFGASGDEDTFEGLLHLYKWKEHQSPKGRPQHLSIIVQASETIKKTGAACVLVKSAVRVSYYRISGAETRFALSVHFDYTPKEAMHPFFHAQATNEQPVMQPAVTRELGFTFPRVATDVVSLKNVRIPTCDMTLPSVLLCLTANHLSPSSFAKFQGKVKEYQRILPRPGLGELMKSIQDEPEHLCSSHWFAHTA